MPDLEQVEDALRDQVSTLRRAIRAVPRLGDVRSVAGVLREIEALHGEYLNLAAQARQEITVAEQLSARVADVFQGANADVEDLIRQRDAIKRARPSSLESPELAEKTRRDRLAVLLTRARRYGVSSVDELESLLVRDRRLSAEELRVVGDVANVADSVRGRIRALRRANRRILGRTNDALDKLEQFVGVRESRGLVPGADDATARINGALQTFRRFRGRLEQQSARLLDASRAMRELGRAADSAGKASDVDTLLTRARNIALAGALVAAIVSTPASPVAGAALALGLVFEAVNRLVSLFQRAREKLGSL